jgi:hypothetical protein
MIQIAFMYIDWRCVDVIDDTDCFYVYWLKMCRCYRWYRLLMYIDWRCVGVIDNIDCFYVYWLKMCRCYRWYRLLLWLDVSYINVLIDGMNRNEMKWNMQSFNNHKKHCICCFVHLVELAYFPFICFLRVVLVPSDLFFNKAISCTLLYFLPVLHIGRNANLWNVIISLVVCFGHPDWTPACMRLWRDISTSCYPTCVHCGSHIPQYHVPPHPQEAGHVFMGLSIQTAQFSDYVGWRGKTLQLSRGTYP